MDPIIYGREFPLRKIVSGGQTGVDRAALDAAIFLDIEHGGWCPRGRRSEDGPIDLVYNLIETNESDYSVRTEKNVIDSDGTLILHCGKISGGTQLTFKLAKRHHRPCLALDLANEVKQVVHITRVCDWIVRENVHVLNVAGPRESSSPGITQLSEDFLASAFA